MEKIIRVEIVEHTIYATFTFIGDKNTKIEIDLDESKCIARRRRKFGEMFIGKDIKLIEDM